MEHISTYTDGRARELRKGPDFVKFAVMLGIIVALNVFLIVSRSLILAEPKYENYCKPQMYAVQPATAQQCTDLSGTWNPAPPPYATGTKGETAPQGYCDLSAKCQKEYQTAHEQYALYAFIFGIAFGVLAIIVGVLPIGSSIVSAGLSYGGVLSFIIASVQYWGDAGSLLRFGISTVALAALIYLGIKRFRD